MSRSALLPLAALIMALAFAPVASEAAAAESRDAPAFMSGLTKLDSASLNQYAGGAETETTNITQFSSAKVDSVVSDNTISGGIGSTGTISNNSLVSNTGFTTLIANSGNQVSISQVTNVNVIFH